MIALSVGGRGARQPRGCRGNRPMSFVDHWASGPRSVVIGRTPTEASRKCVATVRRRAYRSAFPLPRWLNSGDLKDQIRKLRTGQRPEIGKSWKTIEN